MKKILHPALFLLIVMASCKKSKDITPEINFSPMTPGSTWTYQPAAAGSYTLTATTTDTTINGRNYRKINSSAGAPQYWAKSANEYYRYGTLPGLGGDGMEELYLKDNQPVNTIWTSNQLLNIPGVPFPIAATLKYTIKEKDISHTASGTTYNNVIRVGLEVSVTSLGALGGGDAFYANGVGLVENTIVLTYSGTPIADFSEVLVSYHIQ